MTKRDSSERSVVLFLRVRPALRGRLRKEARRLDLSMNAYATEILEEKLGS